MARLYPSLLLSVVIAASSSTAEATLIAIDLPGGNLNEVTRDTVTGLDWLDVPETVVSFNNAVSTATSSFGAGWRHATGGEVCNLFARYALAPSPCPHSVNFAAEDDGGLRVQLLQTMIGVTYSLVTFVITDGLYDDGTVGSVGWARLAKNPASVASVRDNQFSETDASTGSGNFLVRVIPEPSTGLLVIAGLLGLAGWRRARD